MSFEPSTSRLWRTLPREVRLEAARAFWNRPGEEAAALAAQEIVKLLRVRPQAFHKVPLAYSGDNAAMIAFAAQRRLARGEADDPLAVEAESRIPLGV